MKKVFYTISAVFLATLPVIGFAIISLVLYSSFPGLISIIIAIGLTILSFWFSLQVFKRVYSVGPFEFYAGLHSSSDLDNLKPAPNSLTKLIKAQDFANDVQRDPHIITSGSLRIFGNRIDKSDGISLQSAEYSKLQNTLTLTFDEDQKIEVKNPINIFKSPTFFKIVTASSVKISFNADSQENFQYLEYTRAEKSIITKKHPESMKHYFDVYLDDPAIYISCR